MYGKVDKSLVLELRACVSSDASTAGVLWKADAHRVEGGEALLQAAGRDQSFHNPAPVELMVSPRSVAEVAAVVRLCAQRRIPITPRGAGTGIEGGAIPYAGGVVLCTEQLHGIEVNKADGFARVGAGVRKHELNEALRPHGLLFGPDPSSNPCLGGMASTGGSGMSTPMYGTTKENVLSLTVVTAEGEIVETRRAVRKSSTGYDLTQLYMGSEGTLGVIVSLVVRVRPIPRVRSGALLRFNSVRDGAAAVIAIVAANLNSLARCELLNADGIAATNHVYHATLPQVPTLILEFQASSSQTLARDRNAKRVPYYSLSSLTPGPTIGG